MPKRPDNGTGMAIRLNPTATSQGQHLKTGFEQALNFPERSYSSTFNRAARSITRSFRDRGFQLWVLPQTSARADIVMDTNQHGALINASGNFAMRYINTDYDTGMARGAQYLVSLDGHAAVWVRPRLDHVRQRQGRCPGCGHLCRRR